MIFAAPLPPAWPSLAYSPNDREKREALTLWAEHVTALVEGRKAVVVPMKRA
jgi:hypothetical protein